MTQRGRPSTYAALAAVPQIPGQGRPEPPDELDPAEAVVWRAIVGAMPDFWFGAECQPILRQLCAHIVVADGLAARLRAMRKEWTEDKLFLQHQTIELHEKESKAIVALSQSLRLTPKSRYRTDKAETAHRGAAVTIRPWEKGYVA